MTCSRVAHGRDACVLAVADLQASLLWDEVEQIWVSSCLRGWWWASGLGCRDPKATGGLGRILLGLALRVGVPCVWGLGGRR